MFVDRLDSTADWMAETVGLDTAENIADRRAWRNRNRPWKIPGSPMMEFAYQGVDAITDVPYQIAQ